MWLSLYKIVTVSFSALDFYDITFSGTGLSVLDKLNEIITIFRNDSGILKEKQGQVTLKSYSHLQRRKNIIQW